MFSLYARVSVPHIGIFGRVIARYPCAPHGVLYRILIETADNSHVEALYGASSVRLAVSERVPLRLVASEGVGL